MEMSYIIEKIIEGVAAISIGLGTVYITKKVETGKNKLDLKDDFELKKKIKPILEEVRYELDANKVHYWVFSNGDVTMTGHHLKKMSIFEEANNDNEYIAHLFQLIPTKSFERSLSELYDSDDGFIVSNEFEKYDDLSSLYKLYDTKTVLKIKVIDSLGRWVGVLGIWFKDIKPIDEGHIAFAKIQASRIGAINNK